MVTFIGQKPSFFGIMMYILGKSFVKPRLILDKIMPGPGFWTGPGTRSITAKLTNFACIAKVEHIILLEID